MTISPIQHDAPNSAPLPEEKPPPVAGSKSVPAPQEEQDLPIDVAISALDRDLKITTLDDGRLSMAIIDRSTGDTVREIPDHRVLEMLSELRRVAGLMFDATA